MQNVVIDEDWLRQDLAEYSEQVKAVLTREEYEHEREKLRRELLRDPRLRACIRKLDGKPSSPAKFKALATYTVSRFKAALDFKAERKANGKARGPLEAFRDLDRSWGDRGDEVEKAIAACSRDHDREAVHGEEWKGTVVRMCPDQCGWSRRVQVSTVDPKLKRKPEEVKA